MSHTENYTLESENTESVDRSLIDRLLKTQQNSFVLATKIHRQFCVRQILIGKVYPLQLRQWHCGVLLLPKYIEIYAEKGWVYIYYLQTSFLQEFQLAYHFVVIHKSAGEYL